MLFSWFLYFSSYFYYCLIVLKTFIIWTGEMISHIRVCIALKKDTCFLAPIQDGLSGSSIGIPAHRQLHVHVIENQFKDREEHLKMLHYIFRILITF